VYGEIAGSHLLLAASRAGGSRTHQAGSGPCFVRFPEGRLTGSASGEHRIDAFGTAWPAVHVEVAALGQLGGDVAQRWPVSERVVKGRLNVLTDGEAALRWPLSEPSKVV